MEIEDLANINKVVGFRQVLKGLNSNQISKVVLAEDADGDFLQKVNTAAAAKKVPVIVAGTKVQIATICGVDRIATVVGILK